MGRYREPTPAELVHWRLWRESAHSNRLPISPLGTMRGRVRHAGWEVLVEYRDKLRCHVTGPDGYKVEVPLGMSRSWLRALGYKAKSMSPRTVERIYNNRELGKAAIVRKRMRAIEVARMEAAAEAEDGPL